MKIKLVSALLLLAAFLVRGQGTFVYDQHSTNLIEGSAGLDPSTQPMGQSFTPTLSSVSFVMLILYDGNVLTNLGGTVVVNLRSTSITGTILGSSLAVFIPDEFFGITNFLFSTPVPVTPGTTYYFQPVVQSGNAGIGSYVTDGSYAGGTAFGNGLPWANHNLWFQEGIVVPEPSSALLALLGVGAGFLIRRQLVR